MDRPAFLAELDACREAVEAELRRQLPEAEETPAPLHEALRYCVEAGGKRLRPVLLCKVAEALGADADPLPAAAAVECLHSYSLVHDDLPAMDNSDLRRGRPTCHRAYDEATAILAGDALLTLAFEILATAYPEPPGLAGLLVAELASAAGSRQLVGGQAMDLAVNGQVASAAELAAINERKTGALFAACTAMGATLAGAEPGQREAWRAIGHELGAAFQAIDDVLDATASAEETGKTAGQDATNLKNTLVALEGVEATRERARHHTEEARRQLELLLPEEVFLREMLAYLRERTH